MIETVDILADVKKLYKKNDLESAADNAVQTLKEATEETHTEELVGALKYFSGEASPGKFVSELLAQDIMKKVNFATISDTEEVLFFSEADGIWREGGEVLIKKIGVELLGDKTQAHFLNETIAYIKAKTYIERKNFDSPALHLLPVENGVLNLNTYELCSYKPDYFFTSKLHVRYNQNADCSKIKKFLSEVVAVDDVDLLLEAAAYCLWRDYSIQKAFMLVGDGANGKSTYLGLLYHFLGTENTCAVSLQDLEHNRFAAASLYRKVANIYADLPSVSLKNPGTFKMLTGGDLIRAEKKFQDAFFFKNYAKLIYSANRVPYVEDESAAFFRRWLIVNFPFKFENENANLNMLRELTTPEEMSGFLNLLLQKLTKILHDGFSYTKSTAEIRESYIRASDPLASFVLDCVVQSVEDFEVKDSLYTAYSRYCRERKLPTYDKAVFSKNIRRYIHVEEFRPKIEGKRIQAWKGIKLVNPEDVSPVSDVKAISLLNVIGNSDNIKVSDNPDNTDTLDTNTDICTICHNPSSKLEKIPDKFSEKEQYVWVCPTCAEGHKEGESNGNT